MCRINSNSGTLHSFQVVIYKSCMISKVLQKLSSGLISRPDLPMASAGPIWSTPCPGRLKSFVSPTQSFTVSFGDDQPRIGNITTFNS